MPFITIPFGLFLIVGSLLSLQPGSECPAACSSSEQPFNYLTSTAFLFFFGAGVAMLWNGYKSLWPGTNLPEAAISEEVLAPGDRFKFSYKIPCPKAREFDFIGVFLVYRERVDYYNVDEWADKTFDRLVQEVRVENVSRQAGETLEIDCDFAIPNREMGIRHPFTNLTKAKPVVTSWHIKIVIDPLKRRFRWSDYPLDVQGVVGANGSITIEESELFDLFLMDIRGKSLFSMVKALNKVIPHLHAGYGNETLNAYPYLLLERLTRAEAEAAKDELESAGGIIELCPTGNSPASEK